MFSAEMINFLTIIFSLIIFYIFHIYHKDIANYCKLIDRPKKNKIHKNETALTGSFSILFRMLIIVFSSLYIGTIIVNII